MLPYPSYHYLQPEENPENPQIQEMLGYMFDGPKKQARTQKGKRKRHPGFAEIIKSRRKERRRMR